MIDRWLTCKVERGSLSVTGMEILLRSFPMFLQSRFHRFTPCRDRIIRSEQEKSKKQNNSLQAIKKQKLASISRISLISNMQKFASPQYYLVNKAYDRLLTRVQIVNSFFHGNSTIYNLNCSKYIFFHEKILINRHFSMFKLVNS